MAVEDANFQPQGLRTGVCLGTAYGESPAMEEMGEARWRRSESGELDEYGWFPTYLIPARVAAELQLSGPNMIIPTACAAGNYTLGHSLDLLRAGEVDAMIAGAVEPFSLTAYTGFHKLGGMAADVPRPFSGDRSGMMLAEGAGMLVLEPLDRAKARGARIYAELAGYGLSCDAHHMTSPHPEGDGAFASMRGALNDAGAWPAQIDYVNAHGTGTPANDRIETLAVKRLLGERARNVPLTSIKGTLGHSLGAASALEAIACALSISRGCIPPTMNHREPDPECDLDCVPNEAREAEVRFALSNSFAFGGNNCCLLLRRVEEACHD